MRAACEEGRKIKTLLISFRFGHGPSYEIPYEWNELGLYERERLTSPLLIPLYKGNEVLFCNYALLNDPEWLDTARTTSPYAVRWFSPVWRLVKIFLLSILTKEGG